jgi:hypothetical protein
MVSHLLAMKISFMEYWPVILALILVMCKCGITVRSSQGVSESRKDPPSILVVSLVFLSPPASLRRGGNYFGKKVGLYNSGVINFCSDYCYFVLCSSPMCFAQEFNFVMQPLRALVQSRNQILLSWTQQAQKG